MSDQGGCSCVQGISANLCEENIMFWEVYGIGTEVIFSRVISFIDCTLWVTLVFCSCFSDSAFVFCLLFLSLVPDCVSVSNTQDKTPPVPGSTIKLVHCCIAHERLEVSRVLLLLLHKRAVLSLACVHAAQQIY